MLALILWTTFGSRVAAAEMFVELALGFTLYCATGAGRRTTPLTHVLTFVRRFIPSG